SAPSPAGRYESELITGDVYSHIFRSELDRILTRNRPEGTDPGPAPGPNGPDLTAPWHTELRVDDGDHIRRVAGILARRVVAMHGAGGRPKIMIHAGHGRQFAAGVGAQLTEHLGTELGRVQRRPVYERLRGVAAGQPAGIAVTLSDVDIRLR